MELPTTARDLISSNALAHLATIDKDGKPHVTLAWAGLDGDEVVFATLFDQRKLANIRRDPRVTVSFEGSVTNDWGLREYLVLYGNARVTEGGAPELLQELAYTYIGSGVKFPAMDDPPPGFLTHVTVTKITGMGPWIKGD